jgi:N,N'-diacetyllegionaminate synthase
VLGNKVMIIAEAGVNHNGELRLAKKLVDVAVEAGADVVKFQTFKAENLVTTAAKMADYQIQNIKVEQSQLEMLKKLELSEKDFSELQVYCKEKKIAFLSTGFDLESLEFLKTLKMGLWKVPSGEITNLPYLEFIGSQNEPVILSTGMCFLSEVEAAIQVLCQKGLPKSKIVVLHCTTEYPAPFSDVNLQAMLTMKKNLGVQVGYSDHTQGIEISIAAAALGAVVIEKHFTLDKNMTGPDHRASLEPAELKLMVKSIRNIEQALGAGDKIPSENEIKNRIAARKSLVAQVPIKKGDLFSNKNLTSKRPGSGISPMKIHEVIGKSASRDFQIDELIEL